MRFGWREEVGVESEASRGESCEFSQIMAPPATKPSARAERFADE